MHDNNEQEEMPFVLIAANVLLHVEAITMFTICPYEIEWLFQMSANMKYTCTIFNFSFASDKMKKKILSS